MNRYLNSFLITIFIYIVLAFLIFFTFDDIKLAPPEKKENSTKISLKNITIKQNVAKPNVEPTPPAPTKKPIKQEVPKTEPKHKVEEPKPIIKEPIKVAKPKELPKEVKELRKNVAKNFGVKPPEKIQQNTSKESDIKEAKELQKNILKETHALQEKTLENFLSQKEPVNKEILGELEKLYGAEYQKFTQNQKDYLEKNLNRFQVITQRVLNRLGYPRLAAKLRIGGINTVEFLFHPNGDISDLKIINPSGYSILDEYTLELIQIAYKDYPKPKTTTKLRFRVFYNNYSY